MDSPNEGSTDELNFEFGLHLETTDSEDEGVGDDKVESFIFEDTPPSEDGNRSSSSSLKLPFLETDEVSAAKDDDCSPESRRGDMEEDMEEPRHSSPFQLTETEKQEMDRINKELAELNVGGVEVEIVNCLKEYQNHSHRDIMSRIRHIEKELEILEKNCAKADKEQERWKSQICKTDGHFESVGSYKDESDADVDASTVSDV